MATQWKEADTLFRHARAGGHPVFSAPLFAAFLDSRFRGNDASLRHPAKNLPPKAFFMSMTCPCVLCPVHPHLPSEEKPLSIAFDQFVFILAGDDDFRAAFLGR